MIAIKNVDAVVTDIKSKKSEVTIVSVAFTSDYNMPIETLGVEVEGIRISFKYADIEKMIKKTRSMKRPDNDKHIIVDMKVS